MDADEFWGLIDATRPTEPDPDLHADAITRALVARGVEATVAFQRRFDLAMDALYRWDVWGAVYLLRGGCSDDSFEYVRAWVVGEGRSTWDRIRTDPEAWAVAVVDDVVADEGELFETLAERGLDDAESLLYAAGTAHEELTGQWTPADAAHRDRVAAGPTGEEWDEDDVEAAFPRLAAAMDRARRDGAVADPAAPVGAGWAGAEVGTPVDATEVAARLQRAQHAVVDAEDRFARGDHAGVVAALTPVLDDPQLGPWLVAALPQDMAAELLYHGGVSRLQCGDPDGAADWLGIAVATGVDDERVRRALAQVEMSRGELDRAEALLDTGPGAAPMDLAISTAAAGYRRDHAEVLRRSAATLAATEAPRGDLHPWDLAGMYVLVGLALVEVGEWARPLVLVEAVRALVDGAPPEVPLAAQGEILAAGAHRLAGDLGAAEAVLGAAWPRLQRDTCDLGIAEREAARLHRAAGRASNAAELYDRAVVTFRAAGERFLAADTEREAIAAG